MAIGENGAKNMANTESPRRMWTPSGIGSAPSSMENDRSSALARTRFNDASQPLRIPTSTRPSLVITSIFSKNSFYVEIREFYVLEDNPNPCSAMAI